MDTETLVQIIGELYVELRIAKSELAGRDQEIARLDKEREASKLERAENAD